MDTTKVYQRTRASVAVSVLVVALCVVATGFAIHTAAAEGSPTSTVWVYLPVVMYDGQPTNTPTRTATSTPVATPTPTRTVIASGVQVLANHSAYVDSIDYLHIVGEVQNSTISHLRFVKIAANVYGAGGQLLDTAFTYTWLDNVPAGSKTCFQVLLKKPSSWSSYDLEPPTYWTDGRPLPNLVVLNDSGAYDQTFHWYKVIGQVRNDHGARVQYVSPVGTLYDASGTVVGCHFAFVNSTHLDPGQTSSFQMTFSGRDYAEVASYRLQVDGNPD